MPVWFIVLPTVARPCSPVAVSASDQRHPPCAVTVSEIGSTTTWRIEERSMTAPSCEEDEPLVKWPPPRTARSMVHILQTMIVVVMSDAEVASIMTLCGGC